MLANELRQLQKLIMSGKVNYDTIPTLDTPAEWLCVVCVVCVAVRFALSQVWQVAAAHSLSTYLTTYSTTAKCSCRVHWRTHTHTHSHSVTLTHTHCGTVTLKVTVRWELTEQSSCLACTCSLCVLSATEATPVGCCCRVSFFPCRAFATARRIFMN